MNDKPSIDENPLCDVEDINVIVANMSEEERAEYLAWCDQQAEAARTYQMETDPADPA